MNGVKRVNLGFWTRRAPGLACADADLRGKPEFYERVDAARYRDEPYLPAILVKLADKSDVVLEIGFGLGTDLRTLARAGAKVTGLDYSPENARVADLGLRAYGLEGKVYGGDAERLPFPDCSFDIVYSWGCLHHTPDTAGSIEEVRRVLRPGGKTLIMLYHKGYQYLYLLLTYFLGFKWLQMQFQDYISSRYDNTPLSQMFSRRDIRNLFAGWEDLSVEVMTYGGIQHHPFLKYVWKLLNLFPSLMRRFGGFALIRANKPGMSDRCESAPAPCCPVCRAGLMEEQAGLRCRNPSCRTAYPRYKDRITILHTKPQEVVEEFQAGCPAEVDQTT